MKPRLTLADVAQCESHRCACRARGVLKVRGYGRTIAALYDDALGRRITAGSTSGPRVMRPQNFEEREMQDAILGLFSAALDRKHVA